MTPVIAHLKSIFPELPSSADQHSLSWNFAAEVNKLGPDFYRKVVPLHPILNLEYAVLCNQLRHNFAFPQQQTAEQVVARLTAALMLAELLEHTHLHYLAVPREVVRLRRHQQVYREILSEMAGYNFSKKEKEAVDVGYSLSNLIRENTAFYNWYRLLITRSKRVLNFLDLVGTGSQMYRDAISFLDKYTNTFFAYLAWCFFIPRLSVNLFLMLKHAIPGFWMDDKERELGLWLRMQTQLQRRWFELGNDLVWVTLGVMSCFVLTGALAPVVFYLTLFAFAFDVANSALRAYIELNRLYQLQTEFLQIAAKTENGDEKEEIKQYESHLIQRIQFEKLRMALHLAGTIGIFLGMALAIPALAINPVLPLIGALLWIAIWLVTFTLTQILEQYRPSDVVEKPVCASQAGFFAPKAKVASVAPSSEELLDTANTEVIEMECPVYC